MPLSLENLIALNDELSALARAGLPLEAGLRLFAADARGELRAIVDDLARRLEEGQSLAEAAAREPRLPPVYQALLKAGARGDNLSAALAGLSTAARHAGEARRAMAVALLYPVFLIALAYLLFCFTVSNLAPATLAAHQAFQADNWPARVLRALAETAPWWQWQAPVAAAGLLVLAWWWTRRRGEHAALHAPRPGVWGWFTRWPSPTQTLRLGRWASCAELLALLLEQHTPLPEALELAAQGCGERSLERGARELAAKLRAGAAPGNWADFPAGWPTYLGWLVCGGPRPNLVEALRRAAASYRERANRVGQWWNGHVPALIASLIGGSVVAAYGVIALAPFFAMLWSLGQPK